MLEKYPGESALFDIDCSELLAAGETITGTPTMAHYPTGGDNDLTFGAPEVNQVPITYADGRTAPAGTVVQVRISGGSLANNVDDRRYSVTATFTTSNSNTLQAKALLTVKQVYP